LIPRNRMILSLFVYFKNDNSIKKEVQN